MSKKNLYEGTAENGPMQGKVMVSRCQRGILLVDKEERKVWIYDWREGTFVLRAEREMIDDPSAKDNRYRAAEESDYDVIAAPWVGADDSE